MSFFQVQLVSCPGVWLKIKDISHLKLVAILSTNKHAVHWGTERSKNILNILHCCRYYSYIICLCLSPEKNIKHCSWRVLKIALGLKTDLLSTLRLLFS